MENLLDITTAKVKTGHTTFENALVVDNYPSGFQKTEARFWVETKVAKGNGDISMRIMRATKNPRNGRWCKPKNLSVYEEVMFLLQDDNGFVSHVGLYNSHYTKDETKAFVEKYKEFIPAESLARFPKY